MSYIVAHTVIVAVVAAAAFGNALGNAITDTLSRPEFSGSSGIGVASIINNDFRRQEIAQMNAQAQANASGADEAHYNTLETQRFERQVASDGKWYLTPFTVYIIFANPGNIRGFTKIGYIIKP